MHLDLVKASLTETDGWEAKVRLVCGEDWIVLHLWACEHTEIGLPLSEMLQLTSEERTVTSEFRIVA